MSRSAGSLTAIATALAILGLAVAVLLTPPYVHAALANADSAAWLGVSAREAEVLSDRTVDEMVFGPATFAFSMAEGACLPGQRCPPGGGHFYDDAEASHLGDARVVLYGLAAAVALAIVVLALGVALRRREPRFWRSVARGAGTLAVVFGVVGAIFLVAFEPAFTLFHEIFFPGGNWSFDPATEHLVQLYPMPFWELTTTVLGSLVIVIGLVVWYAARRRARALGVGAA